MNRLEFSKRLIVPAIILIWPTLIASGQSGRAPSSSVIVNKTIATVAFGDSNTTDFAGGIVNWYERIASFKVAQPVRRQSGYATVVYSTTLNNQSVGGTSVAPTMLGTQNAQYDIVGALNHVTHADIGFVMLGTNDAYRGVTVSAFVNSYEQLISTIHASGKVNRLVILSVPPMTPPYNCISGCYPFPHNPEVDRVVLYNQQANALLTYCLGIHFACSLLDSSAQIPLNSSYIDPGTGIHLLNPAQAAIANNVFAYLSPLFTIIFPPQYNPSTIRP